MERLEKLLIFRVGPAICCVTSNSVETIMRPPEKETHGKDGNLPEIFRHGGRIARVVDVRLKFGLSAAENAADGNIILSKTDKGLFAFWVDQIINVIDADEGKWGMLPPKLPRDVFSATFMLNDDILLFTDFASIQQMKPSVGLREHLELLAQNRTEKVVDETTVGKSTEETAADSEKDPVKAEPAAIKSEATGKAELKPEPKPAPSPRPVSTPVPKTEPIKVPERPRAAKPAVAEVRETTTPRSVTASAEPAPRVSQHRTTATPPPPMPKSGRAAQTPPRNERVYVDDDEEEGSWLFPLIVMLTLVAVLGGGWYFYNNLSSPATGYARAGYEAADSALETDSMVEDENPPSTYQLSDEPVDEPQPDNTLIANNYDTPPAIEEPQEEPQVAEPILEEPVVEQAPPEDQYSATIEKEDNVLTITLDNPEGDALKGPEETDVPKPTASDISEAAPADSDTAVVEEAPAEETGKVADEGPEEPVAQTTIITHVVEKGDTLWDIAEKYVKDPYKYPELAKYSDIKNPDLIYPGDIVRIQTK